MFFWNCSGKKSSNADVFLADADVVNDDVVVVVVVVAGGRPPALDDVVVPAVNE